MTTITETAVQYEIVPDAGRGYGYLVLYSGVPLMDSRGNTRNFSTRNSARKAVVRSKRPHGDRHR